LRSPELLILARALQGVGAALLVPNFLAIIGASFGMSAEAKR
jgi:MFS family permease